MCKSLDFSEYQKIYERYSRDHYNYHYNLSGHIKNKLDIRVIFHYLFKQILNIRNTTAYYKRQRSPRHLKVEMGGFFFAQKLNKDGYALKATKLHIPRKVINCVFFGEQ